MNARSSRSHSLFTLYIENNTKGRHAKFQFIDLAGSERIKSSLVTGDALKEAQAINKSLFTLAQVIMALTDSAKSAHVPYRNSKLTELLSDSFGGNAYCMMVTCLNPTCGEESIQTMKYSTNAMKIKNKPMKNDMDENKYGNKAAPKGAAGKSPGKGGDMSDSDVEQRVK